MIRAIALVCCLIVCAGAGAAPPTLNSNGSTHTLDKSTVALNVGNPSTNDLMVEFVSCSQETNLQAASITPPAGWTTVTAATQTSADTFYIQKLFYKIATGSEGATQNFTFQSTQNCNIGAWYFVIAAGTFDTSSPVDANSIAWANSLTQDPPSVTFTSGPRDGLVIAYSHTRSDNSYSSGSDLGTNAHYDGGGTDMGRGMAISYGGFTSTSSKDPGAIVFTGVARPGASITAVVYATLTPAFSSGPTYAKVDNNTLRATFTASASGFTARGCLYPPGSSAPTAAQIAAGTGCHGTCSVATTGSSQTLDCDATDSPAFPKYDPYYIIDNAGTYSAVPGTSTTQLDPPSTCGVSSNQPCQYVTLGSVSIGGIASIATLPYVTQTSNFIVGDTITGGASGALGQIMSDADSGTTGILTLWVSSGAFQNGETVTGSLQGAANVNGTALYLYGANDVLVAPTYVIPGGPTVGLTIAADGNASYTSGSERETAFNIKVYDYSAFGYAAGDIDFVNNDASPSCNGVALLFVLPVGTPMTALDLDNHCSDSNLDTLSSTVIGTLPTGLTHNGTTNITSGTPTVENEAGVQIRYVLSDPYGAVAVKDVTYYPIVSWTITDCTSSPTNIIGCTSSIQNLTHLSVTVTPSYQCNNTVAAGVVTAQSPVAGGQVSPGATVTLTASSGPCAVIVPNCLNNTVTMCTSLVTAVAPFATVTAGSGCVASTSKIYSQGPAVGETVASNFNMTVFCR